MVGETRPLPTEKAKSSTQDRASIWGLLRSLAHLTLGDVWSRVGWVNEMVRCYERALAAEPRQPWIRRLQVELLAGLDRWEEAEISARELLRRSPEDAEAHRVWGRCLLKVGRYEEAPAAFGKARVLAPDGDSGLWEAICLGRLGRDAEALERLGELVRQHPDRKWPRRLARIARKRPRRAARRIDWEREAERLESETPLFETPSEPPIL